MSAFSKFPDLKPKDGSRQLQLLGRMERNTYLPFSDKKREQNVCIRWFCRALGSSNKMSNSMQATGSSGLGLLLKCFTMYKIKEKEVTCHNQNSHLKIN